MAHGNKHLTGVFRTHEVLILGFLFCKHASLEAMEDAFWDLINPDQTRYVLVEDLAEFLTKMQNIAIVIPAQKEKTMQKQDQQLIYYFRNIEGIQQ